jgi:hypothetical protein
LRGSIDKALALNRNEVRSDGLLLEARTFRLAITWRARDVHPWDRNMAADRKMLRRVEQTFSDTLAALERLFIALPEVDVIDLTVLQTRAINPGTLLNGLISRREFETCRVPSPAMKLRLLGVNYNLVDSHLEPLAPAFLDHEIPASEMDASAHPGEFGKGPQPQGWHQDKAGPH